MRRRAVTIVELIVVVALVAILLGLLTPVLFRVKAASVQGRCLSHLRSLATAATSYTAVYDAFPAAIRYEPGDAGVRVVAWDWETTFAGQLLGPGPLWSFGVDPGASQQCPAYDGGTNFADPATGYNYNTSYLGGEATFPQMGWSGLRTGLRPAACRRSSATALFGDGGVIGGASAGVAGIANKFMRCPLNEVENDLGMVYAGAQAFRHMRETSVAYVDCHVGSVATAHDGVHATSALRAQMGFPDNGFLSEDASAYDPR